MKHRRFSAMLVLCAAMLLSGCADVAAPESEGAASTASAAAVATDPGPSAIEIKLTSFDIATLTVTGYNKLGWSFTGRLTAATSYEPASISRFIPGDPCRDVVLAYNDGVSAGEQPVARVDEMALLGCNARTRLTVSGTIRTFQPAP